MKQVVNGTNTVTLDNVDTDKHYGIEDCDGNRLMLVYVNEVGWGLLNLTTGEVRTTYSRETLECAIQKYIEQNLKIYEFDTLPDLLYWMYL